MRQTVSWKDTEVEEFWLFLFQDKKGNSLHSESKRNGNKFEEFLAFFTPSRFGRSGRAFIIYIPQRRRRTNIEKEKDKYYNGKKKWPNM